MSQRVGFVGLGTMGAPMAANLARARLPLTVYNRSSGKATELVALGASEAASPRAVAAASDVVFTMLPDSPDVAAVLRGSAGIFAGAEPGTVLIDSSTISPLAARAFASEALEHGVHFVDAPVSGGPEGAAAGSLSIMAGGSRAAFDRALPLLEIVGTKVTYCGPSGAGQIVKACNQLLVALHLCALGEALVLGTKAGVDARAILQALSGGLADSRVLQLRGERMAARDFAPLGRAAYQRKDLGFVMELGREYGVPLPLGAVVDQLFAALIANGGGDLDHSAVVTVLEKLAAHRIGE